MQRSKAAVSVEVKRVVGALCRLLAAVGLDAVPAPEAFRRAKFEGGSEEDEFLQLLADILQSAGIVSCETRNQPRGERRRMVAAGLWQTGYHAAWMYGGDGGRFSSRDLLLALGWLMAAGTLEKLLTRRVWQLDKSLLSPVPVKHEFSGDLDFDAASLRRLQWLMGHLRHQRRILLSTVRARTRALHDVLSAVQSSSPSLSSNQSSSVLQEDGVRLQQLCDLLEAYASWKQVEEVFWTWMDSVVDLTDPCIVNSSQPANGSPAACHHGDQRLEKLKEVFMCNELPVSLNVNDRLSQEALKTQTGSRVFLLPPPLSEACRAKLRAEEPVRRPAGGPQGASSAPGELPAPQAAETLLHAETLLLQRRERRRLASRTQLQDLIGCLDHLVLIPL
ncbi:tubulin epsilon and delta complex protein 1 [Kryptolebias marmoratus]|uniref:tubulin epsilon and delta complex protein 1 n=1 Tax=Kryptolebias marmoratus TaxID=37003 RepID=UPI0007F8D0B0|nr:tubulin epsilon and delta complex protein 1 [Kryptolebias marmoratus]